jgi:arylsulfatase A-like enzyme
MAGAPKGNVLFITLDQWRGDCLSAVGHPVLRTPILDQLAADGVLFVNHFTQASPCGPARASLYTGMYLQNHRSGRNGVPLDARHTNVALEARKAGYVPVLFGYTDTAPDPRGRDPQDPALDHYEGVLPGMIEKLRLHNDLGPWLRALKRKGHAVPGAGDRHLDVFTPVPDYPGAEARGSSFAPPAYPAEDSHAAFMTGEAIRYLEARGGQPWFVHLSYWQPHPPFIAPEPYNSRYDPADVPAPRRAGSLADEAAQHPFTAWRLERLRNSNWTLAVETCPTDMTDGDLAQLRATYYGMINEVEDNLGRLFGWLKESGQYDDTLIVLTTDHGEQMGDHWMLGKENYYDESFHIPLILRDPRAAAGHGRRVEAFTEAIDIMPTILDWIGVDIPRQCDGHSLGPWLGGETPAGWRDAAHWEYDFRDLVNQTAETAMGLVSDECHLAVIRDEKYKYVHFAAQPPLFFDLECDSDQLVNRAGDPDYATLVLQYAQKMLSWRMQHDERTLTHMQIDKGVFEHAGARRIV